MALNAKEYKQESKFDKPEPLDHGSYPGRVVQVVSLGLQEQQPYKGESKDPKHEIRVTYELADEFMLDEDGNELEDKPRWISEKFTMNSLNSDLAKSTKRYLALDPDMEYDGDWSKMVGMPCMITVVQNPGKGKNEGVIYNNVASISTMRAKEVKKLPELKNEPLVFDVDEPDVEVFLSLPEFIQKMIKENLEYEGSLLERLLEEHEDGPKGGNTSEDEEGTQEGSESVSGASEGVDSGDDEDW